MNGPLPALAVRTARAVQPPDPAGPGGLRYSRSWRGLTVAVTALSLAVAGCGDEAPGYGGESTAAQDARMALLARGDSLELDTRYVPPPGDPLHHHTSGFAKVLCSAVFLTGLDPQDAAANVGGFTSPFEERHHVAAVPANHPPAHVRACPGLLV